MSFPPPTPQWTPPPAGPAQPGPAAGGPWQPGMPQAPWGGAVPAWFAPAPARRPTLDRARLIPTALVAVVIAAVVLGGIGLDNAIAAPSAGWVNVGGPVYMRAGAGWVRGADSGGLIGLQKGDVTLKIGVAQSGFTGSPRQALSLLQRDVTDGAAQVNFGEVQDRTFNSNPGAEVSFEALVADSSRSMTVDGILGAINVGGNLTELEVIAPQGDLDPVFDEVQSMLGTLEVRS